MVVLRKSLNLGQRLKEFGVIGENIEYSASPAMHSAGFTSAGLVSLDL